MIIQSDQVRMDSRRSYRSTQADYTNITRWNASGATVFNLKAAQVRQEEIRQGQFSQTENEQEEITEKDNEQGSKKESLEDLMSRLQSAGGVKRTSLQESVNALHKIREQAIDYLLYILFGRKYSDYTNTFTQDGTEDSGTIPASTGSDNSLASTEFGEGGQSYTFFYHSEQETTCFDAKGVVKTADGREIPFNMNVEMSREFTQMAENYIDFGKPRLCDPLVINLNGNVADVADQKFMFDLDADGNEEEISMLESGSGYLALDKNGDGIINDGSELFGTSNGNGFADLAQYDKDSNGWIDEADEIFDKLRIWVKDADSNDNLMSLSEAGVGAIYLGSRDTEFSLNNLSDNHTNGVIRKTGMFLYENGQAGTMQQLDLAT